MSATSTKSVQIYVQVSSPFYVATSAASNIYVVCPRPKRKLHFFWTKILNVRNVHKVRPNLRPSLFPILCRKSHFFYSQCPPQSPIVSSPFYVRPPRPIFMYVHVQKENHIFFWTKILNVRNVHKVRPNLRPSLFPILCTYVRRVQYLCSMSTSKKKITFFLNKNSQRPQRPQSPSKSTSKSLPHFM